MCRSRKDITKRNEARERSTIRQSVLWADTSAASFTKCSRKNATIRCAPKRGIPRPRSARDRALKRKYGGRNFSQQLKIQKFNRARENWLVCLKFAAGCSGVDKIKSLDE